MSRAVVKTATAIGWVALRVVSVALGLLIYMAVRHYFGSVGVIVMVAAMIPALVWLEMRR